MTDFIKLTQTTGKSLLVNPTSIEIIETVPGNDEAKTGVWLTEADGGTVQYGLLTDNWGWLHRKLPKFRNRVDFSGPDGKKISIPTDIIQRATETNEGTVIQTHLRHKDVGTISILVLESVEDIMDIIGVEDNDSTDENTDSECDSDN